MGAQEVSRTLVRQGSTQLHNAAHIPARIPKVRATSIHHSPYASLLFLIYQNMFVRQAGPDSSARRLDASRRAKDFDEAFILRTLPQGLDSTVPAIRFAHYQRERAADLQYALSLRKKPSQVVYVRLVTFSTMSKRARPDLLST